MVLGKFHTELKKQFARKHSSGGWTNTEIKASILKEIQILEVSLYSNGFTKLTQSTARLFHTAAGKSVCLREKREIVCTYFKGSQSMHSC